MTKTRNISDLLDANGDVKSTALDNVPASNDASALTTGTLPSARLGTVTSFTSTGIDDNATSTAITINSSGILNTGKVIVRKDGASETEQLVILNQSVDSHADLHFKGYAYRDRARIRAVDSSSSATGGSMKIETSGGTSTDGSSLETRILLDKNGNISFYEDTGTTPKMFWDATNERLGVGTTSPSAVLDVRDETNGANFIVGGSGTTNITKIGGGAGDSLQLFTNSTTPVMLLSTSGNVGIGTTSPGANLEINSGSYGSSNQHQQWSYNGTPFLSLYMNPYTDPFFDTDSTSTWNPGATMVWKRQGSEKMRIDSSGNVGIGTTSPSEKLDVNGNAKFTQTYITADDETNVFREITQVESSAQGWMVSTGALPIPSPGIYRVTAFCRLRWNVGGSYYKMALFSSTSNTSNLTEDRLIIEHIEDDHGGFANVGMSADWIIDVPTGNTSGANVYVGFFAQSADSVFRCVNDGNGRPYFMATKLRETTTSGTTLAEIRTHN